MNILIPHTWLLEHLETNVTPTELQKLVSLCGPSVERIYDRAGDSVYDIEITTNRVDSMSVRGIAREAAVILHQFGHSAKLKPLKLPALASFKPASIEDELPLPKVTLKTPACHRVLGVVLKDLQRQPTPKLMATRLQQTDQNIHDAAIDITNYITRELGHPCHAFDYDKIMSLGGEIIITEAKPGQKFITLDGAGFTTVGGEIVFQNPAGEIIDLPAIKGTLNTSISATTKNILFWIESLDAKKVRVASMTHAIRTVAAELEEKQADPHLAELVLARGIELFQEFCQAKIGSQVYDAFILPRSPKPIKISLKTIETYLGLTLPITKITQILTQLECRVEVNPNQHSLTVTPPTFRHDLEIPADIVEEIARIYGYQNLPSTLMSTAIPVDRPRGLNFDLEFQLQHGLANRGWQELYTYSLVSEALAQKSGWPLSKHLKIANPLTDDKVYLRRSLLPSLQTTAEEMLAGFPAGQTLKVFELANLYPPSNTAEELPAESLQLALVSNQSYREVRGELETLLGQIYRSDLSIKPNAKNPDLAEITLSGQLAHNQNQPAQKLGSLHRLGQNWWGISLTMSELVTAAQTHPVYQPAPKTAALIEDLTFTIPPLTPIGSILTTLKAAHAWISSVTLKNQFQANSTFTLTYRHPDRTLTNEEIAPVRRQIVALVVKKLALKLVGQI